MLPPPTERLIVPLHELLAIEDEIAANVRVLTQRAHGSVTALELLSEVEGLACAHAKALRERLQDLQPPPGEPRDREEITNAYLQAHPASTALRDAYALLQRAIVGYAGMETISHRLGDSWIAADAGTTSHIGRDHAQEYLATAGRIMAVIHDLVIEELEADELFCCCTCPACSLGLCVCAPAGRAIFAEPWMAAKPPVAEHGVGLHIPRPGSAADNILRTGDVVVAVDGERIEALGHFQQALRGGPSPEDERELGELVPVTVQRGGEELTLEVPYRREGHDMNEEECLLPSGQGFYLDQAKNVQRRLRRERPAGSPGTGLAALSVREIQVLRLLGLGATNPMIAEELEIARATVKQHVEHILAKLGLSNRTEAATLAAREGLLEPQ